MATTAGDATFIDTNVLVNVKQQFSPFHSAAVSRLDELRDQGVTLWINRQVLREYLVAMSRPGGLTKPVPMANLVRDVREFSAAFLLADDDQRVTEELLRLLTRVAVAGKQVHDANVVATMLVQRIPRLLTNNVGDFARFSDIITILPLVQ
jgi:predicted nucleic acid-binding protein